MGIEDAKLRLGGKYKYELHELSMPDRVTFYEKIISGEWGMNDENGQLATLERIKQILPPGDRILFETIEEKNDRG